MKYTVFACGIFMERFHPYGLGYLNIGYGSGVSGVGDYLLDINHATAEYAAENSKGHTVRVCLTSVYDVVRFIVAAIDLGPRNWPHEFSMRGDRLSVRDVVGTCGRVRNGKPPWQQHGGIALFPCPLAPSLPDLVLTMAGQWRLLITCGKARISIRI
jgi:hypothetical protein